MNRKEYLEALEQLRNLRIAISEKDETLRYLIDQERRLSDSLKRPNPRSTGVQDRDGTTIYFGDKVEFLTKGKHSATEGIVYKVSKSKTTVTARDKRNFNISRAPKNVRVITKSHEYDCCSRERNSSDARSNK